MTARWPTYCARCGRWATALIEAGRPGSGHYRAEVACPRHHAAATRWASHVGPARRTSLATTQPALFEIPEVTC
ncbi:hypothetical protein [Verrucosispora sp. WMMD1129]|uniref:hypothetical protein n=1 Tax=Verrucosispora sp. WMMD1129 TaxID=3016093 RepID=UPI00249CC286|nr:hypothetical protein [Verrucosispora sp. WMMD1129]WFE45695.1 hypothetical protein O7624_15710 [Verrucosispora sp. WMMD1129]